MFLQLAHTKTDVFQQSQNLALDCYRVTKIFPTEEKFAMIQQIRRAALSVHLNLAEGCSRKSEICGLLMMTPWQRFTSNDLLN